MLSQSLRSPNSQSTKEEVEKNNRIFDLLLGNIASGGILINRASHHVRSFIRHRARKYSVVLGVRTVQSIRPTHRHLRRHCCELDCELHRQHWLSAAARSVRRLRVHNLRRVAGVLHDLHIQKGAGNEEQDYRRDQ